MARAKDRERTSPSPDSRPRKPNGASPSKALRWFHVILVLTAIVFAVVYGISTLRVTLPRLDTGVSRWPTLVLGIGSFIAALLLAVYLRVFLRRSVWGASVDAGEHDEPPSGRHPEGGDAR